MTTFSSPSEAGILVQQLNKWSRLDNRKLPAVVATGIPKASITTYKARSVCHLALSHLGGLSSPRHTHKARQGTAEEGTPRKDPTGLSE